MSGDQLLHSPEEGAELLHITRSRMFDLIGSGEIESFKIGRLRRIPREALTDYIERLRAEQLAPVSNP